MKKKLWLKIFPVLLIIAILFSGCMSTTVEDSASDVGQGTGTTGVQQHTATRSPYYTEDLQIIKVYVKCVASCYLDGDTIRVVMPDGKEEKVRLIGVNTPELSHFGKPEQCGAKIARDYTDQLTGKDVWLELDVDPRDKYGRILAYVWTKDPRTVNFDLEYMWNWRLVRYGYAQVMTIPPNVKYAREFVRAERQAREENIGLWEICRDY